MILEAYTRIFVEEDAHDQANVFYRTLLAGKETLRFAYRELGRPWR